MKSEKEKVLRKPFTDETEKTELGEGEAAPAMPVCIYSPFCDVSSLVTCAERHLRRGFDVREGGVVMRFAQAFLKLNKLDRRLFSHATEPCL